MTIDVEDDESDFPIYENQLLTPVVLSEPADLLNFLLGRYGDKMTLDEATH